MATIQIKGIAELKAEMKKFPEAVQARAAQTGVRKAAGKLRTALRRAAYAKVAKGYKRTNRLRQAIRSAVGKRQQYKGKAWVGLKAVPGESRTRHYYKTLEFGRNAYTGKRRGKVAGSPPLKPFWDKTVRANSSTTTEIIIAETWKAIVYEAGKAYGRAKGGR
jgi:HK97 gp10 family phage protein